MYRALYRKYRPVTFDDVISQPHITTALKNQIMSGKTAHAYLFTGSRGTGKTTCARIFAKALNCEHTVNGSPCNECDICRDADNFALADIIEIDAASNGSVNDARELREAAVYTPERCRYKVYIIDEVHMLSKDAFNALLKIIEEPPAHVKFIMATTELHKVLPTILSRCQRFDFMRIRTEDIAARLTDIAGREGISLGSDAALLIAKAADGGMRDALSILDRCIAFSEEVTAKVVSEAAGIAGREYLFSLLSAVADKDAAAALDVIAGLYSRSKDMQRLCEELTEQLRNVMIAKSAPDRTGMIVCLPSELDTIREIAARTELSDIFFCLNELGRCAERMTRSLSKRVDMEMCVIRMCIRGAVFEKCADTERLGARISALEERLANAPVQTAASDRQHASGGARREPVGEIASADTSGFVYIARWREIVDRLREKCPSLAPALVGSHGYTVGDRLIINSADNLIKVLLRSTDNKARVIAAVKDITGRELNGVAVGYRRSLDRSADGGSEDTSGGATETDNADKTGSLLKKAMDGGVAVETV